MLNLNNTPPAKQRDNSRATMVFAIVSSLLVVLIIGIFVAILIVRANSGANINSPNGPYNVGARLLPKTSNPGVVLPATLGDFQRKNVSGSISNFTAEFTRGNEQITVSGGQMINFAAAQQYVITVRDKYGPANTVNRISTAQPRLSIYLDIRDSGVIFAYNHDFWFFNITTKSQSTLDAFMEVFPY